MKYETAKEFCELKNYNHRRYRYKAMEDYFGISAATIKDIISFDRYLRDILDVDDVGLEKEAEWHKSDALHSFENGQLFKLRNITQ